MFAAVLRGAGPEAPATRVDETSDDPAAHASTTLKCFGRFPVCFGDAVLSRSGMSALPYRSQARKTSIAAAA
jgi:hypothetical protein